MQVLDHRGNGDIDHGGIQDDHRHAKGEEDQGDPAALAGKNRGRRVRGHGDSYGSGTRRASRLCVLNW